MIHNTHINTQKNQIHCTPNVNKALVIAAKVLSGAVITAGIALAISGAIVLTKLAIASVFFGPIFAGGLFLAVCMLELTAGLLSNPVTSLGVVFTLPAAIVAGGAAVFIPAAAGALPGIGLIVLGTLGLCWNPNEPRVNSQL